MDSGIKGRLAAAMHVSSNRQHKTRAGPFVTHSNALQSDGADARRAARHLRQEHRNTLVSDEVWAKGRRVLATK